jgi:pentatricopeptide repeat protein
MYAKCGSLGDAQQVFNNMATRNVVTWNAMLGGYTMHGHGTEACRHFRQMYEEGLQVDDVSFVCLLSACSHAGLVDEGICYFDSMGSVYKISARAEHYTCMVDLLNRAGRLHEAEDMINTMSCTPNIYVWKALLGACRIYGNVEMQERVAMRVLELDPGNTTGYCCYQTSMQLLASRTPLQIFNSKEGKEE